MLRLYFFLVIAIISGISEEVSGQSFDALEANIGYGKTLTWQSDPLFDRGFRWSNRSSTSYGGRDLLALFRKHDGGYIELLTFGTDGSIGVRNSFPNPTYALDVNGQIRVRNNIHIDGTFGRSTTFGNTNDYWEIKHGIGMTGVPTIRFKDGRIGITGNGTFPSDWHTSSDLEIFNNGWPMLSLGTMIGSTKNNVTMTIATAANPWYSSLTQLGDFILYASGAGVKNFIIAAPRESQGAIRFTTSVDGVTDLERMHISKDGRVGIGVSDPTFFHLDINGSMKVRGSDFVLGSHDGSYQGSTNANRALVHEGSTSQQQDFLIINYNNDFESGTVFQSKVGVMTKNIPDGYGLAVRYGIYTEQIKVGTYANWPDYVFSEGYPLKSLEEVEGFVKQNGHLPEVPSAKQVETEGIELTEMSAILLKKIEELTLYMLEQDKMLIELKKDIYID